MNDAPGFGKRFFEAEILFSDAGRVAAEIARSRGEARSTLQALCYHEGGHYVVARELGRQPQVIGVETDGIFVRGLVSPEKELSWKPVPSDEQNIAKNEEVMTVCGVPPDRAALEARTRAILDANWKAVRIIAGHLYSLCGSLRPGRPVVLRAGVIGRLLEFNNVEIGARNVDTQTEEVAAAAGESRTV